MEKIKLWVMTIIITMLISSCAETAKDKTMNSKQNDYRYNICLVLDLNPAYFLRNDIHRVIIGAFDFPGIEDMKKIHYF